MWFALRASYLVAVVLCNIQDSLEDEDTKRSFLARRAIDGSRGRKFYDAKDDGFFEDYGFDRGHYDARDRSGPSNIRSSVPGEPGVDYPAYERLPQTSFSCEGRDRGYYADDEAGCQLFHVCDNILVSSFLCPVGSLFSQKLLTCDWWNKVDCTTTRKFYMINRNLYEQDDGDEMIRKAYVMMHLHPDLGLITEPEERERQGKIIHYPRVDAPENDLPNNYDDITNDSELRQPFDDYSNQAKLNSRLKDHYNDHVLFSQEYQTHAPKIYPDSTLIRIHKISNDHHLAYENRHSSNGKGNMYRLPVNEFVNEFQPAYAPTVPTVTTTSRRFYSPTVPMTYMSSTLAYDKFDQNFDSSIHLYAHGKNSLSTTTPATIIRQSSRNLKNSTRGLHKFRGSGILRKDSAEDHGGRINYEEMESERKRINYEDREQQQGEGERRINHNRKIEDGARRGNYDRKESEEDIRRGNYNRKEEVASRSEEDYPGRESYDEFYDEEKFEIMEGGESIGLVRSSSERLEEATTLSSIIDSISDYRDLSEIEKNSTFTNTTYEYDKEAIGDNLEKRKKGTNYQESSGFKEHVNNNHSFAEVANIEHVYSGLSTEFESKITESPIKYHDSGDDSIRVAEDPGRRTNEETVQQREGKSNNEKLWKESDGSKKGEDYRNEDRGYPKEDEGYSQKHQDNVKGHQDYPIEQQDYEKQHQEYPEAHEGSSTEHLDFTKAYEDNPIEHQDYPQAHEDSPKEHLDYTKPHEDSPKEHLGYTKPHEDNSKEHQDYAKEHWDYPKAHEDSPKENLDYTKSREDNSKEHQGHPKEHQDDPKEHENYSEEHSLAVSTTTSDPIYEVAAQLLHSQEKSILELSSILQPPHKIYKSYADPEDHIPPVPRDTQPTRIPIPYQHYSNNQNNENHSNSTSHENHENKSNQNNENVSQENLKNWLQDNPENTFQEQHQNRFRDNHENTPHQKSENRFQVQLDNNFQEKPSGTTENENSEPSSNVEESIPVLSSHQELPKFNNTNINYEEQILRKDNPDLNFTIRTAIWNQQTQNRFNHSSDDSDYSKNPFFNHRSISLDLEPPNEKALSNFEDDSVISPTFKTETLGEINYSDNEDENREVTSRHVETRPKNIQKTSEKNEDDRNVFRVSSTLKPDFPGSITEIEDTIEESNAPYQVSLSVNGETNSETKGFIGRLIKQHEEGEGLSNFENYEIIKSRDPAVLGVHEEPSIVYSKQESSDSLHDTDFRPSTGNFGEHLETQNRTGKSAEIRNHDQRIRILQFMSELAKTNRRPRPFSTREDEILESEKSSNKTNKQQVKIVSSTESSVLRKEEILEQLERSFGQPLYGGRREAKKEPIFQLPDVKRIIDFRTGKAIIPDRPVFESNSNSTSLSLELTEEERVNNEEHDKEKNKKHDAENIGKYKKIIGKYDRDINEEYVRENTEKNVEESILDARGNNEKQDKEKIEEYVGENNEKADKGNVEEYVRENKEKQDKVNVEDYVRENNKEHNIENKEEYVRENKEEISKKESNDKRYEGNSEESDKEKGKEDYEESGNKEAGKTVVEMEFLPSLGFSFDTREGREEYAQAVLQGLVTEEAVIKSEYKFSSRRGTFDSTESTKNFEKSA